jgi:DNA-binding transcriptional regulator GbsR (MarR family)
MTAPSAKQSEFVERVGRFWESVAGSRTAGRIVGWLMICEPQHQSSADLMAALAISSGSASTQIRQLVNLGLVERVTFPGDRASYYHLPDNVWSKVANEDLGRLTNMRKLAEAGDAVLPATRPERVTELGVVAEFLIDEWSSLMERLNDRLSEGASRR